MWWRICQFDTNRATRISVYRKQKQQQDVRLQDSVNTEVDPELEWQHTVVPTGTLKGGSGWPDSPQFFAFINGKYPRHGQTNYLS